MSWLRRWGIAVAGMGLDLLMWDGDRTSRLGGPVPLTLVLLAAAALVVVLGFRSRRPVPVFGAAWAYAVGWELAMPSYLPLVGLLLATHATARHLRLGVSGVLLGCSLVPLGVSLVDLSEYGAAPTSLLLAGLLWCVLVGGVWAAGRYGRLAEQTAGLRVARAEAQAEVARLDERLRLAGDLHDVAAHTVTAVMFQAAGQHRGRLDLDEDVRTAFATIEATATQALRELRELLGLLDGTGPRRRRTALSDELEAVLATYRSLGLSVEAIHTGDARGLSPEGEAVVVGTVRESLANALKHGGTGTSARVGLRWSDDAVEVVVKSQQPSAIGSATRPSLPSELSSQLGLASLDRRCAEAGGALSWGWTDDQCYEVVARLGTSTERVAEPR